MSQASAMPGQERRPQVSNDLDHLNKLIAELHQQIENLETRLVGVLTPPEPPTTKNPEQKIRVVRSVPLANQIMGFADLVENATSRLRMIQARCEL